MAELDANLVKAIAAQVIAAMKGKALSKCGGTGTRASRAMHGGLFEVCRLEGDPKCTAAGRDSHGASKGGGKITLRRDHPAGPAESRGQCATCQRRSPDTLGAGLCARRACDNCRKRCPIYRDHSTGIKTGNSAARRGKTFGKEVRYDAKHVSIKTGNVRGRAIASG